jgi:hypothetical protein
MFLQLAGRAVTVCAMFDYAASLGDETCPGQRDNKK